MLIQLFQKVITVVQLTPPHIHRRNTAERAICTFNNHFVAGLASVDNNFLIYLWFQIVKQEETTIKSLRTSITNPRLLVYAKIFGTFDFNAPPMATPETKIIAHENQLNGQHREKRSNRMVYRPIIITL